MDLVVRSRRMPAPGETVPGEGFVTSPGGKGANQAVAVARMGGRCAFLGRVGDDTFGRHLLAGLKAEGIDCSNVMISEDSPTGVAIVVVDARGENSIIVAGGANRELTPDDMYARQELFEAAAILLVQLELPLPTVRAAMDLARRHGCKVILDPAPAPRNLDPQLCKVDIICPNAVEAETITGQAKVTEERGGKLIASDLIERGAAAAVVKLGGRGSLVATADGHFYRVPPCKVPVADTTAAGDAFAGALAVAVARGQPLREAAMYANAAGALACTKLGAQSAMPTAADVEALIRTQSHE